MKHMQEIERIQNFMNAITNNLGQVQVSVTNESKFIHFIAGRRVVEGLQSLLNKPIELFKNLWKAVKVSKLDPEKFISHEKTEEAPLSLPNSASELLKNIIDDKFVEELNLNKFEDEDYYIASSVTISKAEITAKHNETGAGLIQLVLSNPKLVNETLNNKKPITTQEQVSELNDPTEFIDKNIFSIKRENKTVTTKFNAAAFLQKLSASSDFSQSPPIIAKLMEDKDTYTINLEHLQIFIGSKISPLIFNPLSLNKDKIMLEPIALYRDHSEPKIKSNCLFSIAIDVSKSMDKHMNICKENLNIILNHFVKTTKSWTISITQFNRTCSTKIFNSNEHESQDLNNYINNISAYGKTNLFGTMCQELKKIQNNNKHEHYAFMVISDGADTENEVNDEVVIENTKKITESVNNLQIFTLELGKENEQFFETLTKEGCTHIKLQTMSDLSSFMQYVEQLNCSSQIIEFLHEAEKIYKLNAPSGKIAIGEAIDTQAEVLIGNEVYEIRGPENDPNDPSNPMGEVKEEITNDY